MKTILVILLVFYGTITRAQSESDYGPVQRYYDSLLIYEAYEKEYREIWNLRETDIETWRAEQAENDRLTACAKLRLEKYNRQPYEFIVKTNQYGIGEAYHYRKPTKEKIYCTVYDEQTRFMKDSVTGRMIPYITKLSFMNDSVLVEKLNPITYTVLKK